MSRYQFPSAATTDASLLVSGTLSDARLSANVALENVANVFTAKQSFSGTTHVGLCLNSLTTSEYNALTPANGDLYRDSTTDRIDARLSRGTVELIDTAGGQTIGGALTVTSMIGNSFRQTAGGAGISTNSNGSRLSLHSNNSEVVYLDGNTVAINSGTAIRVGSSTATSGSYDTSIYRSSANTWSLGVGAASGSGGSLNLANLTASGTVTAAGQITAPLGSAATPGIVFSGSNSGIYGLSGPFGLMLTSNGGASMLVRGDNAQVVLPISWGYGWSSTSNPASPQDTRLSRNAAGIVQVGTTANNALGSLLLTNLTASGTLQVGGGTIVANILSATATLDFPSISSNDTHTLTITVTGAVAGDSVFLGVPATLEAGLIFCASVTAANTVTVRMHNSSGGSVDPASGTFRATVIRF